MVTKTHPFNPIQMLHSDAEIAEFLTDAYRENDPAIFITALGLVVKHKGVAKMAEKAGLNRESLYKAFSGKAQPQWSTVHKLLHALGVELSVHGTFTT